MRANLKRDCPSSDLVEARGDRRGELVEVRRLDGQRRGDRDAAQQRADEHTRRARPRCDLADRARIGGQRGVGERDRAEQSEAGPDLADRGMLGQRRERVMQRLLQLAAAAIRPSASYASSTASAAAQHVGCPAYVAPWRSIGPPAPAKNGAATAPSTITPPSGR